MYIIAGTPRCNFAFYWLEKSSSVEEIRKSCKRLKENFDDVGFVRLFYFGSVTMGSKRQVFEKIYIVQ